MPVFPHSRQLAPTRSDTGTGAGDAVNDSKKQLNPEATTEILSLINSDDPGCERGYNPSLCRMRHTVARLKEARGMRHEYEPCAYCPKFLAPAEETTPATTPPEPQKPVEQHQTKPEETPKEKQQVKTYPRSTEKCHCGSTLSKKGYCYACKKWPNKSQSEDIASTFAPKTGAEKSICNETAPKVTQENSNVTFEPAANTIHASRPPEDLPSAKLVIPIQESEVCRRAINQYGILRQMAKAAEEFAEAAAAINRHMATEGSREEIISELADVEVMCVQMRLILGASAIDQQRAEKVARLHGRLKP